MIEIIGPSASPFVLKLLAAADYKGFPNTHLMEYMPPDFAELVSERPALADWYKRVEDVRRLDGGSR